MSAGSLSIQRSAVQRRPTAGTKPGVSSPTASQSVFSPGHYAGEVGAHVAQMLPSQRYVRGWCQHVAAADALEACSGVANHPPFEPAPLACTMRHGDRHWATGPLERWTTAVPGNGTWRAAVTFRAAGSAWCPLCNWRASLATVRLTASCPPKKRDMKINGAQANKRRRNRRTGRSCSSHVIRPVSHRPSARASQLGSVYSLSYRTCCGYGNILLDTLKSRPASWT